ncbi:MAG: hypothetical protein LBD70_05475 [Bifidobacteriaceae bacterium]|nr:hypothetical protein [Bifidobacteriaceae bacterium]
MTPQLTIVRGVATSQELAALTASLVAAASLRAAHDAAGSRLAPPRPSVRPLAPAEAGQARPGSRGVDRSAWRGQAGGWARPGRWRRQPFG